MRIRGGVVLALVAVLTSAVFAQSGEGLIAALDFNQLTDNTFADASANRVIGRNSGGQSCEGVDGLGLRLPGGACCVNLELPEKYRSLDALTLSLWVAPEEAMHQEIVTAAAEKIKFDSLPFMLRWRAQWFFMFEVTTADGERRCLTPATPCVDTMAYPKRKWVHVVVTYDGSASTMYIDGKPVVTATFPKGKKSLERIAHPVKIGGHGGYFKGGVDNLRLYNRAISAAEVEVLYAGRTAFKPELIARQIPGTLDGLPYAAGEQAEHWMGFPLKSGWVYLSNTGQVKLWGVALRNASNQWDHAYPLGLPGQENAGAAFYKVLDGNVESHADGTAKLELSGTTAQGLQVRQRVELTKDDRVKFRYEIVADRADAPSPCLSWSQHLWSSAKRFVGHDAGGLITGNLMDLEGDLLLRGLTEINLIISDNRLVVDLGPDTRWLIHGTRDAFRWQNGYATLASEIGVADWPGWTPGKPAVLEFALQLEPDDKPCRLERKQAREVTRAIPFDFSALYTRNPDKLDIVPADRDVPIYTDREPVPLALNLPAKTVPAAARQTKWFHLVGTYNGVEGRLYLNGKPWGVQTFGIDNKPLRLGGNGTVMIGGPQEPFLGTIDNVRIYRRVLSEAEAKAHFEERTSFKPGAAPDAVGGVTKPDDPALVLWLDFNAMADGSFQDRSAFGLKAKSNKGSLAEGVDGAALHLAQGANVTVSLPESAREFKALTLEAWVSPDAPQHSTILGGLHAENKYNGMPFSLRWRMDQSFWLFMNTPDDQTRNAVGQPAAATLFYPQRYTWFLANSFTKAEVQSGEFGRNDRSGLFERQLALLALPAAVYELKVEALGENGKVLDRCATELAVAGAVAQPRLKPGAPLTLKKVDEVDFTAAAPGHDFYSCSGLSAVVTDASGTYRRTLTYQEAYAGASRLGAASQWANADWFGVRFKTEPGKVYVLESEVPDLANQSMSIYLMEPKDDPSDGKCKPVLKTTSGVFSGGRLPCAQKMLTHQTVHFASAPWVAACYQNAHCNRPTGAVLSPAGVKRATLYEVVGDLPALDAPAGNSRFLGVHCESGGLALSSFGVDKFRGELGDWLDRPKPEEYYHHAYQAITNLIRYMRYRGDTVLYYGIYRYRGAQFPSRLFPSGGNDPDLPMLLARMFEMNNLKVVFTVMPHNVLPTSRLQEFSHYGVQRGEGGVTPLDAEGHQNLSYRVTPAVNPLHPAVRKVYASLAAELGQRYGKLPGVQGIAWMNGQSWWEPCLPAVLSPDMTNARAEQKLLSYPFDDESMRQFAKWAGVTLPGAATDPGRFKQRSDWIQANAREKFIEFRGWGMAQTHGAFKDAFVAQAPGKDYLFFDFYYDQFVSGADWSPLRGCQLLGSAPQYLRNLPGLVYCPYLPEINGCTFWEHGNMPYTMMPRLERFRADDELAAAWDTPNRTGRYLHRQFYEQSMNLRSEANRKWFWAPTVGRLATCSYPQQGGDNYLLDFVLMLANGTPNHISYSWCDSTIPMGCEPQHQRFAAAFRNLPDGHYRESDRQDGVFARARDDQSAFYVVNTKPGPVTVELRINANGKFANAVSGAPLKVKVGKPATFVLAGYDLQVFVPEKKR